MKIELIEVDFHLEACHSLKQKRGLFRGLRDQIGRRHAIAIAESRHQDSLTRASWSFLVLAHSQHQVDQIFAGIEEDLQTLVDATIVNVDRQKL